MSQVKANSYVDASGGNTATINSMTPTADSLQGFRNRIINGDMRIDQRNAGAAITLTASTGGFPVDRMRATNQTDGTFTAQQSTTVPTGFVNSVLLTVTATDTSLSGAQYAQLEQRVEGFNVSDLLWGTANAKTVTLSFWVRSSLTGTFCATLYNSNGSRTYVSTYTINSANTWEQKTITVPGDTSGTWQTGSAIGIDVIFTLAVGSTYQQAAGSWGTTSFAIGTSAQTNFLATNGATFYITGVQLEVGSVATPFERRDYGRELMLCQRYLPAFISTGTTDSIGGGCTIASTTAGNIIVPFKVSARAAPTGITVSSASHITLYNPRAGNVALTALTFGGIGAGTETSSLGFTVASGLTTNDTGMLYFNSASGKILFTGCEL